MTNKEHLATLSAEDWYDRVYSLTHDYGRQFTDTRHAVIDWLNQEYKPLKLILGDIYSYCPFCYSPIVDANKECPRCRSQFEKVEEV